MGGVSDVENFGRFWNDLSSEEEILRREIATNQLQSMYDEYTKELMNNLNIMAHTTDGEIGKNTINNITLSEDISRATWKKRGLLNDETVKSRLEEVFQYVKPYSKSTIC